MELPVLIEPIADNGFRARLGDPLSMSAEGATRDEAVQKLKSLLQQRLANGSQISSLLVPVERHAWMKCAGIFREDDPVIQEWQKAIQQYRDEVEKDPNYL